VYALTHTLSNDKNGPSMGPEVIAPLAKLMRKVSNTASFADALLCP